MQLSHNTFLTTTRTLRHLSTYAWGNGDFGQLGLPQQLLHDEVDTYGKTVPTPEVIPALEQYKLIDASISATHSAFIRGDGTVLTCGNNTYGQLGMSESTKHPYSYSAMVYEPTVVTGLTDVHAVALGGGHSLALTTAGVVYGFGDNRCGQVGIGGDRTGNVVQVECVQILIDAGHQIIDIAAGEKCSAAVCTEGRVYTWGSGDQGELGHGKGDSWFGKMKEEAPRMVRGLDGVKVDRIYGGGHRFVAVDKEGRAYGWGCGDGFVLGNGKEGVEQVPVEAMRGVGRVKKVGMGMNHAIVLTEDGAVWGMGVNDNGCVGIGEDVGDGVVDMPVRVRMGMVNDVGAGWAVSGIVCEGEVFTWGCGKGGALGMGDAVDFWIPTPIGVKGKRIRVGTAGLSMLAL